MSATASATAQTPMAQAMLAQIRTLVENGRYEIGRHTELHMMEEGFEKEDCVGAVMGGRLLEFYPLEKRALVAGAFHLSLKNLCPLHIVCELKEEMDAAHSQVRFITAYIPRRPDWISPHVRARRY